MSRAPKSSLRSLSREPIGAEQLADWLQEINHGSDRSVAIISVANLEISLEQLILVHLANGREEQTAARLRSNQGPLATFHSKIELAYAMGLIPERDMTELHRIRRIRNAFAHTPNLITFATPEVREESMKLKFRGGLVNGIDVETMRGMIPAKLYFTHAVSYLSRELKSLNLAALKKIEARLKRKKAALEKKIAKLKRD